jgi:DNA invertase Pin-like site-specific DNA recombinase
MVKTAITDGDRLTADVKRERRQIDRQDGQQSDVPKTRQKPVSETVRKHAKVERLLTVTPALSVREVARQAGVSESTVSRVKRELPVIRGGLSSVR